MGCRTPRQSSRKAGWYVIYRNEAGITCFHFTHDQQGRDKATRMLIKSGVDYTVRRVEE